MFYNVSMIITKKRMLEMFGKYPDQQIAEELEISLSHVRNFRREQGFKRVRNPTMTPLERNRKSMYGISPQAYTEMLYSQGGACAICGEVKTKYVVDHNHKNGKVRGILCHACNVGIGNLKDSSEILEKAAEYIKSKD